MKAADILWLLTMLAIGAILWLASVDYCHRHGGHYVFSFPNGRALCITSDGRVVP